MFILRDILTPLQNDFSSTCLGRQRSRWFVYTLLAFIIPFTSSLSSTILRSMNTLFGIRVNRRRFYAFIKSNKLPWAKLWPRLWSMIPGPLTDGRLVVALDDCINPKTGRRIFGCSHLFDHAAKANQSPGHRMWLLLACSSASKAAGHVCLLPTDFICRTRRLSQTYEAVKRDGHK
jgi:hypothetical protein